MIETEIKLKIKKKEIKKLLDNIKEIGGKKEFFAKQVTYLFDTKDNHFKKNGLFLRTRTGEINSLTLKKKLKKSNKKVRSREETEIDIGKTENVLTMNKILLSLGYDNVKIMEKYRLQWNFKKAKITLDELPFGFFVEIEGSVKDIFLIKEKLKLDLKVIKKTYWGLFDEYKKRKNIRKTKDIKFTKEYIPFLNKYDQN
jgi:adenylate cyclase class 2